MTLRRLCTRLLAGICTGLAVALVAFLFLTMSPGDPAESIATARAGPNSVTPELIGRIRHGEGLDKPLAMRWLLWLRSAAHGDLGRSSVNGRPVSGELAATFPFTLQLALASTFLAIALSVAAAIATALHPGSLLDRAVGAITTLGVSMPEFWLGQLLILVFAVYLGILPGTGTHQPGSLILPALTTSIPFAALGTRLLRGALRDVLAQPYIRAARARGLGEWRIAARHALPNAIHASLPLYSVQFAGLLEGTVIVESLFGRPGCGRLLVEAVLARDFPVMQGCLLILGMLCVAVTTLAQIVEVLWSPASSVEMLPLDTRPVEMQTA